jgi:hypothetical protein
MALSAPLNASGDYWQKGFLSREVVFKLLPDAATRLAALV